MGFILKSKRLTWLWITLLILAIDQGTKWIMSHRLPLDIAVKVLPIFNLRLSHNTGAAFSFLSDAPGWQRWFLGGVAVGVSICLVVWMIRVPTAKRWLVTGLAFILGGALGNLWDRFHYGYVIDFIQVHYHGWYFPVFNMADTFITIGAIMLLIDVVFMSRKT